MQSLTSPPGLHRHDADHEGETAAEWIAGCEERMARKTVQYRAVSIRDTDHDRRLDVEALFHPGYAPTAVVEDLASLDPDFDRHTDQYDRIMSWFSGDICCPGFSYLGRGHCPQHGGI